MDTVYVDADVQPGSPYSYGITSIDYAGNESTPAIVAITTTGVDAALATLPTRIELRQNYPNPFNPSTTISYALPAKSHVTIAVFNTLGQQVASLVNSEVDAGVHEARFDAFELTSGVYLYRLHAGEYVETRKLVLLR
jgi:xylan 1,4-beta-xylosidase